MKPEHLFTSSIDGGLYDTRVANCFAMPPLRRNFERHHVSIETVADLKATLRAGEFAWPGGYQMYFLTNDGAALSFDSVRAELRNVMDSIANNCHDGWRVVACDINYEDNELTCDHSGERIPSAYGD